MTNPVTLPLWAFVLILLFAGVTFASHFLFPSVRWFFRKRAERLIAQLNERLARPIEPFKLARRYDMIQRLIYDPEVTEAIVEHARKQKVPENVAFETARRYAREIVPSFSATAYFTFGLRFARWLSTSLYRVRIGAFPREELESLNPDATVIFVMNHRSNMDYVLVTYLVSGAGTLSYAVGEWARVWPLSAIIRAMGAYFIRRRARGALYRTVLKRYVQMATLGGVTQAMFPEGGLSLTGASNPPKLGLMSDIITIPPDRRDVVFVPVALNYDRTLEDRFLIAAHKTGVRRFRPPLWTVLRGVSWHLWQRLTGKFDTFGTASVGFGMPLELSTFRKTVSGDLTEAVATELMQRINAVIPVLAVPLVCDALLQGAATPAEVQDRVAAALTHLSDADMVLPRRDHGALVADALTRLQSRKAIRVVSENITIEDHSLLAYYAASVAHHLGRNQGSQSAE